MKNKLGNINSMENVAKVANSNSANKKLSNFLKRSSQVIGSTIQCLDMLKISTDQDFFSIGSNLQAFSDSAKTLAGNASAAAKQISSEEILKSWDGILAVLNKVSILTMLTENKASENSGLLKHVMNELLEFNLSMEGFTKTTKTLRILSVYTRIESAAITEMNISFYAIAEDVRNLSDLIDSKCSNIQAETELLITLIGQSISQLSQLAERQETAADILNETRGNIDSVLEKHGARTTAIEHISEFSRNVYKNINNIVVSMQIDDITRQKIEHVVTALNEIAERLKGFELGKINESEQNELARLVADTCRIQSAQLCHAKDGLQSEVNLIIRNLNEIISLIGEVSADSIGMLGISELANLSFLTDIQKDINRIEKFAYQSDDVIQKLFSTMSSLAQKSSNMSSFLDEIDEISSNIQLIAINTQIGGAHTGESGKAISVLAEAIQSLSKDTSRQATTVSEQLIRMISSWKKLGDETDLNSAQMGSDVREMVDDMNVRMKTIQLINEEANTSLGLVQVNKNDLARDITSSVRQIDVHKKGSVMIDEVVMWLDDIVGESGSFVSTVDSSADNIEAFRNLEDKYTMETERKIH